jgi:formate-dependent nitrite reductase membrane component NrfD
MPWKLRREVYMLLLGVATMALSVVVLVLNRDVSSDLLAVIGLLGGVAIIINALPSNGNDK